MSSYNENLTPIERLQVEAEVSLIEHKKAVEMYKYIGNNILMPAIEDYNNSINSFNTEYEGYLFKIKNINKKRKKFHEKLQKQINPKIKIDSSQIHQNIINYHINRLSEQRKLNYEKFHKDFQTDITYNYSNHMNSVNSSLNQYHESQTELKKKILQLYTQIAMDLC